MAATNRRVEGAHRAAGRGRSRRRHGGRRSRISPAGTASCSIKSGPWLRASFTRRLTGRARMSGRVHGPSRRANRSVASLRGSSHSAYASGRHDHRHPIVHVRERRRRRGRHHATRLEWLAARRIRPALPQPCHAERRAVGETDEVRLLHRAGPLPLVVAVGQHQAAAATERAAERWLLGKRLGTRVDHPCADRLFLRPRRHQPPVQHRQLARPAGLAHGRDVLRRRDVVARLDFGRRGHAEQPRHGLVGGVEGEAATHGEADSG